MTVRLAMSLHELSVRRADRWVLRNVSWLLRPGDRWALVGDNGAGKTQLLKVLSGDVWPVHRAAPFQAVRVYRMGTDVLDLTEAKLRIAYVGAELQDKYARYEWNLPVRDLVATGLHRSDLLLQPVTRRQRQQVAAVLRLCGITRYASRKFLSLSYGQKRLGLLARALVQDPDWLLLDEIYNGLDVDYRRRVDEILRQAHARGQSWVATAHRAADIPGGTRQILELEAGEVKGRRRIRPSDGARLAQRAGENDPPRAVRPAARKARSMPSRALSAWLLQLSQVDLYVDYRCVLRNVEWKLRSGEHWAIYGANGAGKSSFLKLLYGDLLPALGGRIERAGHRRGSPVSAWKRRVGYVSPELQSDYAVNVSLIDLVASGRHSSIGLVDALSAADRRQAMKWLRFFGLLTCAGRQPRQVSYGQLRRALIARAMAAQPRLLLLDEPLTGLDPTQRRMMKRLLRRLMQHTTVIIAVHHAEDLPQGMTHGLHLHNGRAYPVDSYFCDLSRRRARETRPN